MSLTKQELAQLRHPSEDSRFFLTLFVLIPLGILVAAVTVTTFGAVLIAVPIVLFFLWFSLRLWVANYMNNAILVTHESFPSAYRAIAEAKSYFSYDKNIDAYVYEDGTYNIWLMPLLNTKVLLLNSDLMRTENSEEELRFLIGRFVGGLASKHFRFSWLQVFIDSVENIQIFNLLLYPYERAVQLSGDRMGLAMIDGNIQVATRSMIKLVVGTDIADQVSIGAFLKQERAQRGSFFRWLVKALSRFPHSTTRVYELVEFAKDKNPHKFRRKRSARAS